MNEKKYGYFGRQMIDPTSLILKRLWEGIHILGSTFDSTTNKTSFKCFFYSLANLLPSETARSHMYQFIKEYPIDNYLQTNSRAFYWTYLLHDYFNVQLNKRVRFTFEDSKKLYDPDEIDKTRWGQSYWILIHIIAKYLPINSRGNVPHEAKLIFIDFIRCLQRLLPCERCRGHLSENLKKYPIEKYLNNRQDAFTFTVNLHNEVNESLGLPKLDVKKARILY
jgi:hypothetical protein